MSNVNIQWTNMRRSAPSAKLKENNTQLFFFLWLLRQLF